MLWNPRWFSNGPTFASGISEMRVGASKGARDSLVAQTKDVGFLFIFTASPSDTRLFRGRIFYSISGNFISIECRFSYRTLLPTVMKVTDHFHCFRFASFVADRLPSGLTAHTHISFILNVSRRPTQTSRNVNSVWSTRRVRDFLPECRRPTVFRTLLMAAPNDSVRKRGSVLRTRCSVRWRAVYCIATPPHPPPVQRITIESADVRRRTPERSVSSADRASSNHADRLGNVPRLICHLLDSPPVRPSIPSPPPPVIIVII